MAIYSYVALNPQGKEVKGTIEADNATLAATQVREMGYFPTRIKEQRFPTAAQKKREGGALQMTIKIPGLTTRVKPKQLTEFTRQLATLIDAGLPLVRSLNILRDQAKPGILKDILTDLVERIEGGSTFSEALAQHPQSFSKLYINMVKAGEMGGILEVVLNRIAEFMEKELALKRKIRGAMVYPVAVAVVAGGIVSFIMTFIIPTFKKMFQEFGSVGAKLPLPTRVLILISDLIKTKWYYGLIGLFFLIIAFKLITRTSKGKFAIDFLKLKLLIFGPLFLKTAIARFTRTLGTLINSGVPILQALAIVRETSGNEVISRAMVKVHDSIREGESIAKPLEEARVFPPLVVHMVGVGEETGALDTMLIKVADAYEDEVDTTVAGLASVLEPLLLIGMGVVVGFIVISLFLPLIKIAQMIH